jgi:tetratricopeptide (TPR) repeat protein
MTAAEVTASEMIERLKRVREGASTGEEYGFTVTTVNLVKQSPELDYAAIAELYTVLQQQSMFQKQAHICLHLALLFSDKMNAEALCSALSEQNMVARREPDVALDGARLFYNRGRKAFATEEFRQAKKYFLRSVEIAPHFREGWLALAGAYEMLGQSDDANDAFARAASL